MHPGPVLLVLFVIGLAASAADAEPGPTRTVSSVRLRESSPDGALFEARLAPDLASRFAIDDPLLDAPVALVLRVSMPEDLTVRLEIGPPEDLAADSAAHRAAAIRPGMGMVVRQESSAVVLRRGATSVHVGLDPFTLRMVGPTASLALGDSSGSPALVARWDSPTGAFFDAWVRLETSAVDRLYGGFPKAAGLNNLFLDGSSLAFLKPDHHASSETDPHPPPPISPIIISTAGWGFRLRPHRTLSVHLRGSFEIGTLASPWDATFAFAREPRTRQPGDASMLAEVLERLGRGAWRPPPPTGIALDPAWSRDSQTPGPALAALYITSRRLDIPANVLVLDEWRSSPALVFRRAIPGPGDTYGLEALTRESSEPQVSRMVWTGNMAADFSALRRMVRSTLVAGLSGLPAVGFDFHSFLGRSGEEEHRLSADLYKRWTQFLAFCPVMQMHGRLMTHEPWLYADPSITAQYRDYAWIHVNLKPYLEGLAAQSGPGRPLMRAPVLAWPQDAETRNLDDAYLLGPDLYVAPVLDAGRTNRPVYLPEGSWYDFWSDGLYAGGRWLASHPAPQENIPVFVRAGAVLPLALDPTYSISQPIRGRPRLTLRFYPDARGEAAGEAEAGSGRVATFLLTARNGTRTIRVSPTRDTVTLWIPGYTSAPRSVRVQGRALRASGDWDALDRSTAWLWDRRFQNLLVHLPPGPGRTVMIGR